MGDRVEFTLVRAAVVRLRLTRDGAHEVRVHAHHEAEHVHRLDDIRAPATSFLVGIYLFDGHIVILASIGRDVERQETGFAAVIHAREEV